MRTDLGNILWVPWRTQYWPASVLSATGTQVQVQLIAVQPAVKISELPLSQCKSFLPHYEQLSKQSSNEVFTQACRQAMANFSKARRMTPAAKLQTNEMLRTPGEMSPCLTAVNSPPGALTPYSRSLRIGSTIRLRAAKDIHNRLADYALSYATIVEIPTHPNTWYGVRLWDNKQVKLRKSAFTLCDESQLAQARVPPLSLEGKAPTLAPETSASPSGASPAAAPISQLNHSPATTVSESNTVVSFSLSQSQSPASSAVTPPPAPQALTYSSVSSLGSQSAQRKPRARAQQAKAKTLVGKTVLIHSGRGRGRTGVVESGGHGYYRVRVHPNMEEMKKRGDEMQEVTQGRHTHLPGVGARGRASNKRKREGEKKKTAKRRRPSHKPKQLIGKRVLIIAGKGQGQSGICTRSGHGFYAVSVPGEASEIMKREAEIKVQGAQETTHPQSSHHQRYSRQASPQSPNSELEDEDEDEDEDSDGDIPMTEAKKAHSAATILHKMVLQQQKQRRQEYQQRQHWYRSETASPSMGEAPVAMDMEYAAPPRFSRSPYGQRKPKALRIPSIHGGILKLMQLHRSVGNAPKAESLVSCAFPSFRQGEAQAAEARAAKALAAAVSGQY